MPKPIRWYHKATTEVFVCTSVVNALIVYNKNKPSNKKISITRSRDMLVDELLELDQSQIDISDSPTTPTKRCRKANHTFEICRKKITSTKKLEKGAFIGHCHTCSFKKS